MHICANKINSTLTLGALYYLFPLSYLSTSIYFIFLKRRQMAIRIKFIFVIRGTKLDKNKENTPALHSLLIHPLLPLHLCPYCRFLLLFHYTFTFYTIVGQVDSIFAKDLSILPFLSSSFTVVLLFDFSILLNFVFIERLIFSVLIVTFTT